MNITTINDLRDFIASELKKVSEGSTTPANANAVANLAGKMLSSVKLELEYNKICGSTPNIAFINKIDKIAKLEDKMEVK